MGSEALGVSQSEVMRGILAGKWLIQHGAIQQVLAPDLVMVTPSVVATGSDYMAVTCVLCSLGGSSCVVDVVPKVHDKVLLLSPKTYSPDMFNNPEGNTLVDRECQGYSPFTCIAILCSQLGQENVSNRITVDGGTVHALLGYDGQKEKHNLDFMLNADGSVSIRQSYDKDNNKYHANVSVSATGEFKIQNDNATVTVSANGNVSIDTKGKFTIKSNDLTLKSVLEDFATEIKQLITTGSPATQQTSPATQRKIDLWVSQKLEGLLT